MKKRNITICIIVGSLIVCFPIACFSGSLFYFWYHDTHTGSFNGRVIDAVTGEPIEGAVVAYYWLLGGFMGISIVYLFIDENQNSHGRGFLFALASSQSDKEGHTEDKHAWCTGSHLCTYLGDRFRNSTVETWIL